jgi:glucose/arabinose dehydrogenase
MNKNSVLLMAAFIVLAGIVLWVAVPGGTTNTHDPVSPTQEASRNPQTLATNLTTPWEIIFLPDGRILTIERPGTVRILGPEGKNFRINEVHSQGEGGLLGAALHPDFSRNQLIYFYLTYRDFERVRNRVERYQLTSEGLTQRRIILDNIPGASNHNGGRIAFGPDNFLYITTGDAQVQNLAQDTTSLAGKILRVDDIGRPAPENPFGNEVYSYGHRNPQGLAWDNTERLWATEHGSQGNDELNLIEPGKNYGWPIIQGSQIRSGMETPVIHSTRQSTWAPAGMVIINDTVYFVGLRGNALYRLTLQNNGVAENAPQEIFKNQYGRLRALVERDGALYFSTSNRDGRGQPHAEDDRIIHWRPQ